MESVFRAVFRAFAMVFIWSLVCLDPDKARLADILHVLHSRQFWLVVGLAALLLFSIDLVTSDTFGAGIEEIRKRLTRRLSTVRG